jgi:hypothetical protein
MAIRKRGVELPDALRGAADIVIGAFARAAEHREFEDPALRESVEAFAVSTKRDGIPPERLVVLLKHLVRNEALPTMNEWFRGVLTDRAVSWGIRAYFGPTDRAE